MSKDNQDYDKKIEELESIITDLQSSELDLDHAVEKYEKGTKLIAELEEHLKEAKNKITKVSQGK